MRSEKSISNQSFGFAAYVQPTCCLGIYGLVLKLGVSGGGVDRRHFDGVAMNSGGRVVTANAGEWSLLRAGPLCLKALNCNEH